MRVNRQIGQEGLGESGRDENGMLRERDQARDVTIKASLSFLG